MEMLNPHLSCGQRLRQKRIEADLSQQKLADAMSHLDDGKSITRAAIANLESGDTKEPEATTLIKAAKILNVSPEWLLFGKEL
jgi:transcriptional regulator with XRE-family HTH domain